MAGNPLAHRAGSSGYFGQVDVEVVLHGQGQGAAPEQPGGSEAAHCPRRQAREQGTGVAQRLGLSPRNSHAAAGNPKVPPPWTVSGHTGFKLLLQGKGAPGKFRWKG